MSTYQIGFPNKSVQKRYEKKLNHLDAKSFQRIKSAINDLAENPRPPGKKFRFLKPPITVYQYVAQYRLRVGDYRVLYDLDDRARKVILLDIRRRSEKTYR